MVEESLEVLNPPVYNMLIILIQLYCRLLSFLWQMLVFCEEIRTRRNSPKMNCAVNLDT